MHVNKNVPTKVSINWLTFEIIKPPLMTDIYIQMLLHLKVILSI